MDAEPRDPSGFRVVADEIPRGLVVSLLEAGMAPWRIGPHRSRSLKQIPVKPIWHGFGRVVAGGKPGWRPDGDMADVADYLVANHCADLVVGDARTQLGAVLKDPAALVDCIDQCAPFHDGVG